MSVSVFSSSNVPLSARIQIAVTRLWHEAQLAPTASESPSSTAAVVPLWELAGAFPLAVEEVSDMTYGSASGFLQAELQRSIALPGEKTQKLSGFLHAEPLYSCILVEKTDRMARRRFSVAHELGHYMLHFLPFLEAADQGSEPLILTDGVRVDDEKYSTISQDELTEGEISFTQFVDPLQMEREANAFAATLLMPESVCRQMCEAFRPKFGFKRTVLARRMATEFLVSRAAMSWRLQALGLGEA